MSQIKVYGVQERLNPIKATLSDIIHFCMVEALGLPTDKKFPRFFPMNKEDFYYPSDRTDSYKILEISMFEGRTLATYLHCYMKSFIVI
ncbi:hypothetical protein ACIQXI_09870 [Lysinibacillus sp. NPDC097195]|uniref:hypothetical protein n=1 Tax=Lysinibacillus sp. NPDC097195 TaxID=3364141 RepID=UPI003821E0CB